MRKEVGIGAGFHLLRDGDAWCAVGPEFLDLQRSPAGFGNTPEEAVKALAMELRKAGYPHRALRRIEDFTVHGP